jgi:hypothetical protein
VRRPFRRGSGHRVVLLRLTSPASSNSWRLPSGDVRHQPPRQLSHGQCLRPPAPSQNFGIIFSVANSPARFLFLVTFPLPCNQILLIYLGNKKQQQLGADWGAATMIFFM